MKFLEVIKDSLVEDYRKYPAVNYSLLKEIIQGNYTAIRDGIPSRTSIYMDFGSYIDKVITEGKEPDVFVYKHTELSANSHSKTLVDRILELDFPEMSLSERVKLADEMKLWSGTKDPIKRENNCNDEKINIILSRETARKEGKDVISEEDLTLAKYMLNVLYTHDHSKSIVSPPLKIESFNQLALKFEYQGIECKVLLDFLQINHKNKTIQPIDLKTGSKSNFLDNYFKYYYWIQGTLYYLAIENLIKSYSELKDYEVLPFKFLYISRARANTPLTHTMSQYAINQYELGYDDYRGQWKKGIVNLIDEYRWHKETNIYDMSMEESVSNGDLMLPNPY